MIDINNPISHTRCLYIRNIGGLSNIFQGVIILQFHLIEARNLPSGYLGISARKVPVWVNRRSRLNSFQL